MNRKSSVPEVGDWAKAKLDSLGKYLHAYTTILKERKWLRGYVYIDAFAGTGQATVRSKKTGDTSSQDSFPRLFGDMEYEEDEHLKEFIKGSPRVALDLRHPFTQYVFIEKDRKRYQSLGRLKKEYSQRESWNKKILLFNCDSNEYFDSLLRSDKDWSKWRGVVFLDPFGTQVPWKTISALGKTGSFEVFINVPCMAINRMAENTAEDRQLKYREKLNTYFGSEEWLNVMYETQSDLLGPPKLTKKQDAAKQLIHWYKARLESAFGFVSSARLIRNSKNSPLYYLIWAGRKPVAKRIMNDILSQGEKV